MSRYEKNLGEKTLAVGWDAPMNTFFAQVSVNQGDDDLRDLPLELWIGIKNDEYTEMPIFARTVALSGYANHLTREMRLRLLADQMQTDEFSKRINNNPIPEGWTKKL